MVLGSILKKWRLMSEISLQEAAKKIGIEEATLSRVENGKMPSAETLRLILTFLMGDAA
jgi:transcriptional regulator with XRE-family HTH domain